MQPTGSKTAKSGRFCFRAPRALEGAGKRLTSNVRLWGCSTDPGLQLSSRKSGVKRAFAPPTAPDVRLGSHSRRVASRQIAAISLYLNASGSRGGGIGLPGKAWHAPTGMSSKGSRVEVVLAPHHPATAATEGVTVLRDGHFASFFQSCTTPHGLMRISSSSWWLGIGSARPAWCRRLGQNRALRASRAHQRGRTQWDAS